MRQLEGLGWSQKFFWNLAMLTGTGPCKCSWKNLRRSSFLTNRHRLKPRMGAGVPYFDFPCGATHDCLLSFPLKRTSGNGCSEEDGLKNEESWHATSVGSWISEDGAVLFCQEPGSPPGVPPRAAGMELKEDIRLKKVPVPASTQRRLVSVPHTGFLILPRHKGWHSPPLPAVGCVHLAKSGQGIVKESDVHLFHY